MNWRRITTLGAAIMMLGLLLTACGSGREAGNSAAPQSSPTAAAENTATQVVHGIINKIDSYLVLLTEDEEYQIMDYGEGIVMDGFSEGDSVDVTYTGQLGDENATPVITAIEKSR
jgi:hypothetical protein